MDSGADGYVRAEGCGTVMLQDAKDWQQTAPEGREVLALVHATAVNQDGRSSSLTAPNGPSQQGVIRQALQASALEPHQLHALQLHGTGTRLLCASVVRSHVLRVYGQYKSMKHVYSQCIHATIG